MQPRQIHADDPCVGVILKLLKRNFAYMDGRVDPPSSVHRLTEEAIAEQTKNGEVWAIGMPAVACAFFTPGKHSFYVGKFCVEEAARGRGLARTLMEMAEARALAHHHPVIELRSRIELVEVHKAFEALGFEKVGEGAHEGADHPTYIVMHKHLVY